MATINNPAVKRGNDEKDSAHNGGKVEEKELRSNTSLSCLYLEIINRNMESEIKELIIKFHFLIHSN